jgi:adenylate cyclase
MLADVAGYSRMMERDERGTHLRLREVRASVTDPAIARHHGRIVRSKGDDFLVEFSSAVEALSCGVEIQRAMAERNRDLAPDSRIEFRIGINLGDILIDGAEIAGDGVNVAARLESLAEPGEVAISQAVREQVRQLVGVRLIDAGHHRVKNISRPIRVFKVSADATVVRRARMRQSLRRLRRPVLIAAAMGIAALAVWRWPFGEPAAPPPRESVLVLPAMVRAGNDAADLALADDLTQQLTTAMTKTLSGVVVATSTASRFKGASVDAREAGAQMKVRFVVTTVVTGEPDAMRISAQLISAESGAQLWTITTHPERPSGANVPIDVVGRLSNALAGEIRRAELARPLPNGASVDAYTLSWRAAAMLPNATTDQALDEVRQLYARAVDLEPDNVTALSGLAMTIGYQGSSAEDEIRGRALLKQADELSTRAVSIDANHAFAWLVRSTVLYLRGQLPSANEAIDRALSLNPYTTESHAQRGLLLISAGRSEEAVAAFDRALRLNPEGPSVGIHLHNRCRAYLYLGKYEEAIDSCVRATAFAPEWLDYVLLTAAYAMHGNGKAANQAKAELLRLRPQFRISWLRTEARTGSELARRQREAHIEAGLRKAGVPE